MSFIFIPPVPPHQVPFNYWGPDINDYPDIDKHYVESFYKKEIHLHSKKIFMLKVWCYNDPRIPKAITTTQLVQFFYAANLNLVDTFELLLKHFAIANTLPEIFTDRCLRDEDTNSFWDNTKFASFPVLTPKGSRILYTALKSVKDEDYNMIEHVKIFLMGLEASLLLEGIPKGGYTIVIDTREFPMVICFKEYKSYIIKFLNYFQEGSPFVINDIHVLCYSAYNYRFSWVRKYLSKENNDKLHFHVYGASEIWKFYEIIPEKCLPKELNGFLTVEIGSLTKKMRDMIVSLKRYFKSEEAQRKSIPELDTDKMKSDMEEAIKNAPTRMKFRTEYIQKLKRKRDNKMYDFKRVIYKENYKNVIKQKQSRNTGYFIDFDPYEIAVEENLIFPEDTDKSEQINTMPGTI